MQAHVSSTIATAYPKVCSSCMGPWRWREAANWCLNSKRVALRKWRKSNLLPLLCLPNRKAYSLWSDDNRTFKTHPWLRFSLGPTFNSSIEFWANCFSFSFRVGHKRVLPSIFVIPQLLAGARLSANICSRPLERFVTSNLVFAPSLILRAHAIGLNAC